MSGTWRNLLTPADENQFGQSSSSQKSLHKRAISGTNIAVTALSFAAVSLGQQQTHHHSQGSDVSSFPAAVELENIHEYEEETGSRKKVLDVSGTSSPSSLQQSYQSRIERIRLEMSNIKQKLNRGFTVSERCSQEAQNKNSLASNSPQNQSSVQKILLIKKELQEDDDKTAQKAEKRAGSQDFTRQNSSICASKQLELEQKKSSSPLQADYASEELMKAIGINNQAADRISVTLDREKSLRRQMQQRAETSDLEIERLKKHIEGLESHVESFKQIILQQHTKFDQVIDQLLVEREEIQKKQQTDVQQTHKRQAFADITNKAVSTINHTSCNKCTQSQHMIEKQSQLINTYKSKEDSLISTLQAVLQTFKKQKKLKQTTLEAPAKIKKLKTVKQEFSRKFLELKKDIAQLAQTGSSFKTMQFMSPRNMLLVSPINQRETSLNYTHTEVHSFYDNLNETIDGANGRIREATAQILLKSRQQQNNNLLNNIHISQ